MALELKTVTELVNKYAEQLGQEALAEIGEALLESDVPMDTSEVDALKAELEAEKNGRAADKAEYVEKINKFIYGGEVPDAPGDPKEPPIDTPEEAEDFSKYDSVYEMVYGKE